MKKDKKFGWNSKKKLCQAIASRATCLSLALLVHPTTSEYYFRVLRSFVVSLSCTSSSLLPLLFRVISVNQTGKSKLLSFLGAHAPCFSYNTLQTKLLNLVNNERRSIGWHNISCEIHSSSENMDICAATHYDSHIERSFSSKSSLFVSFQLRI